MSSPNLASAEFQRAVTGIQNRAERQIDAVTPVLRETFVDEKILIRIQNNKNQLIEGRRGSGKTHLVLQLEDSARKDKFLFFYLDLRRLDSGMQDAAVPLDTVAARIFRSLMNRFHSFALEELVRRDDLFQAQRDPAFECLNRMATKLDQQSYTEYWNAFDGFLHALGMKGVYIVLDEWSSVHRDAQPYLANWIKKFFIPYSKVTLKIVAIPFQSRFLVSDGGQNTGLELGADIFADVDMDTYLVFDKNEDSAFRFLSLMLYKHLSVTLSLREPDPLTWLIASCFTQHEAFRELVRACEGVPRDFLQIFSISYFEALNKNQKIGIPNIRKAAEVWYLRDKYSNVQDDPELMPFLNGIMDEAIGAKKARTFMVEQKFSRHPVIMRLFDYRVLHIIRRGYSHKSYAGVRYDIFSIDYGTYVSLINTAKEPQIDFEFFKDPEAAVDKDIVVPFDDLRRIRCIELKAEFFAKHAQRTMFSS